MESDHQLKSVTADTANPDNRLHQKSGRLLKPTLSVHKLPFDTPQVCWVDEKTEWVQTILKELQEGEPLLSEWKGSSPSLSLNLEVIRRSRENLKNYLTLQGTIKLNWITRCVLTYEAMEQRQEIPVRAAVIMRSYQKSMNLYDETVLFVNDREWDIFYYDKGVDVAEIIHEYIYLNKNPYPKKYESGEEDRVF